MNKSEFAGILFGAYCFGRLIEQGNASWIQFQAWQKLIMNEIELEKEREEKK